MLLKHAIKKRLLCLHVRAYVAITYQLYFRDVSNGEKKGEQQWSTMLKEKERHVREKKDERQMKNVGNK